MTLGRARPYGLMERERYTGGQSRPVGRHPRAAFILPDRIDADQIGSSPKRKARFLATVNRATVGFPVAIFRGRDRWEGEGQAEPCGH